METELDAMQRHRFVKDNPDLLFTFLRSLPARPTIRNECIFNGKAGMFRGYLYGGDLFEIEPALVRFAACFGRVRPHDPLSHSPIFTQHNSWQFRYCGPHNKWGCPAFASHGRPNRLTTRACQGFQPFRELRTLGQLFEFDFDHLISSGFLTAVGGSRLRSVSTSRLHRMVLLRTTALVQQTVVLRHRIHLES